VVIIPVVVFIGIVMFSAFLGSYAATRVNSWLNPKTAA
jgi:cell division protein FtsW (lipid II flippase)